MNFSWKQEEKIIVNFPDDSQMQLTLGIMDSFGSGRFGTAERERVSYLKQKYGEDFVGRMSETDVFSEVIALMYRSMFFGALKTVKARTGEDEEFLSVDLPADWKDISLWCTDVHPEIIDMIGAVSIELNPHSFKISNGEPEKNVGKLSVRRSMH